MLGTTLWLRGPTSPQGGDRCGPDAIADLDGLGTGVEDHAPGEAHGSVWAGGVQLVPQPFQVAGVMASDGAGCLDFDSDQGAVAAVLQQQVDLPSGLVTVVVKGMR